jgi:hypothetical protein
VPEKRENGKKEKGNVESDFFDSFSKEVIMRARADGVKRGGTS